MYDLGAQDAPGLPRSSMKEQNSGIHPLFIPGSLPVCHQPFQTVAQGYKQSPHRRNYIKLDKRIRKRKPEKYRAWLLLKALGTLGFSYPCHCSSGLSWYFHTLVCRWQLEPSKPIPELLHSKLQPPPSLYQPRPFPLSKCTSSSSDSKRWKFLSSVFI